MEVFFPTFFETLSLPNRIQLMAEDTEPTFRVDVSSRPIVVRISGRANFLNCSPLRSFFRSMMDKGHTDFVLDFSQCEGMDSTFLGILAGVAIETQRGDPKGNITLSGLGERNLELVRNLGLHRIVSIKEEAVTGDLSDDSKGLAEENLTEEEKKEMLINAHEDLGKVDEANINKFQDLLTFLKNEE